MYGIFFWKNRHCFRNSLDFPGEAWYNANDNSEYESSNGGGAFFVGVGGESPPPILNHENHPSCTIRRLRPDSAVDLRATNIASAAPGLYASDFLRGVRSR